MTHFELHPASYVLTIAAGLDYLLGDPQGWLHPVQVMGWAIAAFSQTLLRRFPPEHPPNARRLKAAGVLLGLGIILGTGAAGWALVTLGHGIHPLLAMAIDTILLASCFAGRSLRAAAEDVLQTLRTGDLPQTRDRLRRYVGRDTQPLPEPEILRAVLETVSENAIDGVLAPLFYGVVGMLLAIIAQQTLPQGFFVWPCSGLALCYKAASTLDSMVGYREAPYTHLGWFSARLEDHLTWLPCRLGVLTLAVISGHPRQVWDLCQRDGPQDPSPNSGWSECAYAAILGVQLGGVSYYKGIAKEKPLLGEAKQPITIATIHQATSLTRLCCLIWLSIGLFLGCLL